MRGKANFHLFLLFGLRITPAYAGKSALCASGEDLLRDHPRVCGEKETPGHSCVLPRGSPPRMRGKVFSAFCEVHNVGITPAYAGKSPSTCIGFPILGDHPRVCGEKSTTKKSMRGWQGSPPRMRGKGGGQRHPLYKARITPAYAGKSKPHPYCRTVSWDHPRVCGEKFGISCNPSLTGGSPPRMRGKVSMSSSFRALAGITPAYAGKSQGRACGASRPRDHPRVCGEKGRKAGAFKLAVGSPPRMRGKVLPDRGRVVGVGITPAYAGKSVPLRPFAVVAGDHPRVCGEKFSTLFPPPKVAGSPPRMRGKARAAASS